MARVVLGERVKVVLFLGIVEAVVVLGGERRVERLLVCLCAGVEVFVVVGLGEGVYFVSVVFLVLAEDGLVPVPLRHGQTQRQSSITSA